MIEINTKGKTGNVSGVETNTKTIYGNAKNKKVISSRDTIPDKVFTKVENEASFLGGLPAWTKYISRAIQDSIDKFTEADYGTCLLRFIVNTDGKVSDVVATTMKETELAKVSINAIKKGPKWIPATQNGHTVACYRLQPVTLMSPDKKVPSTNTEESTQSSHVNMVQPVSFAFNNVLIGMRQTLKVADNIRTLTEPE